MNQTAVILQARTGSTRLPGKVMKPLGDRPLLSHCIHRLQRIAPVIVATTEKAEDDVIETLAKKEGVLYFRGSEEDVLDRFYQAAITFKLAYILRATGDNPFTDISEALTVLSTIQHRNIDYVSNLDSGLPVGVGIEAFSFNALEKSWNMGRAPHHREHVNEYILENKTEFQIMDCECNPINQFPELWLTVDTEDDVAFANTIVKHFSKPPIDILTSEIISLCRIDLQKS